MKPFLWWVCVCLVLIGLVIGLRSLPDDWKGISIGLLVAGGNAVVIWRMSR